MISKQYRMEKISLNMKYIGRQKDGGSSLADKGARELNFQLPILLTSHQPPATSSNSLWENYYAWTPYHYCGNNPVSKVDLNGKSGFSPDKSTPAGKKSHGELNKDNKCRPHFEAAKDAAIRATTYKINQIGG